MNEKDQKPVENIVASKGGNSNSAHQFVIVTGLSGAGKSSALHAFEDLGFLAIDNLPLPMVEPLIEENIRDATAAPIAIGIDSRTLHFSPDLFLEMKERLRSRSDIQLNILFMDASDDVLLKRFSETRRPHPFSQHQLLRFAIRQERELMLVVRQHIDGILDTSARTGADTRRIIRRRFAVKRAGLVVTFMSFGFAYGSPRDADIVFDVRFFRNPHYVADLKPHTGREEAVFNYVRADEAFEPFVEKVCDMLSFLIPRYQAEGKSYLTVAFGCTGGQHRSVATAEYVASKMSVDGLAVNLYHKELDRK
jgi:UPF0042 nucleotide-binding protein